MRLCCSTSSFRQAYHVHRWDQAALFRAVADCAVDGLIVEDRCFNERAMWWARKGREDLHKLSVELVAVGTGIDLVAEPSESLGGQIANLMEWARIAALSGIPWIAVDIRGPDPGDWSVTGGALEQAAEYAARYGTRFILGREHQPDDGKLLRLARSIGYRRCRLAVANRPVVEPELRTWIQAVTIGANEAAPLFDAPIACIRAADPARAVDDIRDAVARLRRGG